MAQDTPSRHLDQFLVRFPDGMRERIAEAAKESGRSMNAEIVQRLESTFGPQPAPGPALDSFVEAFGKQMVEVTEKAIARATAIPGFAPLEPSGMGLLEWLKSNHVMESRSIEEQRIALELAVNDLKHLRAITELDDFAFDNWKARARQEEPEIAEKLIAKAEQSRERRGIVLRRLNKVDLKSDENPYEPDGSQKIRFVNRPFDYPEEEPEGTK